MIFILYPPSGFVTPALVQIGNQSFKMMYYLWVLPSQAFNAVIIVIIEDVKQGKGQDCLQMAFGCSLSCLNSEPPSTFYSSIPSSQWEYLHPRLTYLQFRLPSHIFRDLLGSTCWADDFQLSSKCRMLGARQSDCSSTGKSALFPILEGRKTRQHLKTGSIRNYKPTILFLGLRYCPVNEKGGPYC